MNQLKTYEGFFDFFKKSDRKVDVKKICDRYGIENWSIVDGLVNVDGNVNLYKEGLTELPLKFGTVTGDFDCSFNELTSLVGCPTRVGGSFDCSRNELTSLEGCPRSVGSDFYCQSNDIREFTGIKYIGGELFCHNNPIFNIWEIISATMDIISANWKWDEDQMDLFEDLSVIQDDGEAVAIDRLNFFLEEIGLEPVEKVDGYINI